MKIRFKLVVIVLGCVFAGCNNSVNNGKATTDSTITDTSNLKMTDSGVVDSTGIRPKSDSILLDTSKNRD